MPGALDGLIVLDLTSHLSGPYAAMMLADQGADVIKIEKPGLGDEMRRVPLFVGGESAPFMIWNRNKRSVVLDLKQEQDRDAFLALADKADVVLENMRPGVMDKLGLGYAALSQRNPRLVYGAISGFGQTGPYRERGGFDLITQAMSGLMSTCGPEDGPPHRLPIAISDVTAGMYLAFGVVAALEARHRTGRGQMVETSLLEAATSQGVYEAAHVFALGSRPPRMGQQHRGSSPYQCFRTADGYIAFGASQQNFWQRLCAIVGMPELEKDARFASNAERVKNNKALVAILDERMARKPSQLWLDQLEEAGIPAGPVLHYDEILTNEHMRARDMIVEVEHPTAGRTKTLGVTVKMSATPGSVSRPAPRHGEHTAEVLGELARKGRG
jgi:crotonobetainyl-CoA:carnitine CoA-transferase CaiB-like acyl-CoA transferase